MGLLFLVPLSLRAYDFKSGDLYYDITRKTAPYTAAVTYQTSSVSAQNYFGLTTAVIPETVTYNGITYSVTAIGRSAFQYTGLTSVTIPNSITSIGSDAFGWCGALTRVDYTGTIVDWCAIGFNGGMSNPLYYAQNLYIDNVNVTEGALTIPEGVTAIGQYAFYNCRGLTSVTIPNSVTRIDYQAFRNVPNIIYHGSAKGSPWGALSVNGYVEGNLVYESEAKTQLLGCSSTAVGEIALPESVTSIGERAFYECKGITSVTIPNSVTNIGERAFYGCSGLISITIPNSVMNIGKSAFCNCSGLTSVTISESVTIIGMNTFYNCSKLTSIAIPDGVTDIEEDAFYGCRGLTSISIGKNVTSIGEKVFYGCSGMTSVTWNAKNCGDFSSYNYSPFYNLHSQITSFTFSDAVEHIPAYLCYGMNYITSITIPESVTSIGRATFYNCYHLTSVTIPENVTTIGGSAFYGCSGITMLEVPDNVTEIGANAFYNLPIVFYNGTATGSPWGAKSIIGNALREGDLIFEDEAHTILKQCLPTATGDIAIPATVTTIRDDAFRNCTNITSVIIPESVTTIGKNAFYNVYNIQYNGTATGSPWGATTVGGYIEGYIMYESEAKTTVVKCHPAATGAIVLPESVTTIEASAFSGCEGITGITIPENVTTIGKDAFYGCKSMSSVVWNAKNCAGYFSGSMWLGASIFSVGFGFPSTVTTFTIGPTVEYLPKYVCYKLTNITEIVIPENVKVIGRGAFCGCTSLTSVTFPSSEIGIEGGHDYYSSSGFREPWPCGVFQNTGLKSITIPDNVTSTGEATFCACDSLTTVIIGKGIDTIGESAFERCPLLTTVVLPDSLTTLSSKAFRECESLTSITLPSALTNISSYCFQRCSSLSSIVIPDKVKKIEYWAFSDCGSLASVSFGNGLTTIGENAFSNDSNLTELVIQENVTYIGGGAFQNCTSLASITTEAIEPPATNSGDYYNSFQTLPHDIPVYVPCGGYELYLASNWGSYFSNIQAPVPPFALYAWSESEAEGSVAIDKTQQCAGVGYLTATPEDGYEFVQWSDGNTDNPRTVELTQDTSFVAEFDVIKSGKCGDDLYWTYRDGEISITGTGAMYDYTVATQPWPLLRNNITAVSICNTATYIGTYAFADCGALRTVRFEDGICAYIADYAFFDCYSLDTLVIPDYSYAAATIGAYAFKYCSGLRSVSLGTSVHSVGQQAFYGCYGLNELSIYSRCSLDDQAFAECPSLSHIYNYNAVPNTCNASVFDGLDKFSCTLHVPQGTTDKYRIASVWRDFYYMEEMVPTYTVSVETASADWGSVAGGGEYLSGTEITLRAVPATGYRFVRWNDGNTDNPRTVTVTEDATYTAVFDVLQLLVTVLPSNDSHGVVTGGGWYNYGETTVLEATPATGYYFYCWQDGSKDNPRTVTVTEDITYTATFRPYTFTVSATADDASRGEVTGSGTYGYGEIATLNAIAYTGYRFAQWSDGNTDNPRTIVLTQDTALTAYFEEIPTYAVSLSCDAEQGTVSGGGTYREGEQVTVSATPNKGYEFVQWSDGNTDNPRSWIVTEDVSLSAIFQQVTALPQTTAASQETQKVVKDGQVLILRNGKAYDMLGQEIR